jgi:FlaA1/EpsC-like NDP-sugar epimerase
MARAVRRRRERTAAAGVSRVERPSVLEAGLRRLVVRLVELDRYPKRAILAVNDFVLFHLALWLAMSLRLGVLFAPQSRGVLLVLAAAPFIGVATFFQLHVYRMVTRFIGGRGFVLTAGAVGLSTLYWALLVYFSGFYSIPRSVVVLYPVLATALIWMSREAAALLLRSGGVEVPVSSRRRTVLIYGAGTAGVRLLEALKATGGYRAVAFVDPRRTLVRQYVASLRVIAPDRMAGMIKQYGVDEVLLAMPRSQRGQRRAALQQLERMKVRVRTLPAMEDLASGRVTVSDLRPVEAEDLLGRDPVAPDPALLARSIAGKSVMVTGAGGSIGSELVRQVIRHGPRRVVLVERSEAHLYGIGLEVEALLEAAAPGAADRPPVVSVLGSIRDGSHMRRVMEENGVETIYHAAAFKHVPLVEHNPVAGLRNNTFGTAILADAAIACGVERLVLVSTDKAVRPTSVMGASKRLAEMMLQARAAEQRGGTILTMVRFGNVLDSSGSVVQRFRRQIEAGGPVTVTHPGMIRYFMSIPEAATLVIQAGAMASGGDVFVLDMGDPVRIEDLARSMIRLMGQEVRDEAHPDGDIAIAYVGARDGEKLFEELLIGENVVPTEHPRILRCREPFLPRAELEAALAQLSAAVDEGATEAIRAALSRAVESYRPSWPGSDAGSAGAADGAAGRLDRDALFRPVVRAAPPSRAGESRVRSRAASQ